MVVASPPRGLGGGGPRAQKGCWSGGPPPRTFRSSAHWRHAFGVIAAVTDAPPLWRAASVAQGQCRKRAYTHSATFMVAERGSFRVSGTV
eukprot:3337747-Alexandrium_andersonii.AAC.1